MIRRTAGVRGIEITQPQVELSRVDESVNLTEQITKTREMKGMIMRRASGCQSNILFEHF